MVKKLLIIISIISILFLVSCTNLDNYVPVEEYNELHSAYVEAKQDRTDLENENKSLKSDIDNLETEVERYQNLIANLNDLLGSVYYGYAENNNWILDGFTAFSLKYNDKFYIITAGHCVENLDTGRMTNFKFKANFDDSWVYPKLLIYENDFYNNRDYAILYSDEVISGLDFDLENTFPRYILGNGKNNIFKEHDTYNLIEGESGSPVIDMDGELIGIATGSFTDTDLVIEAIENLE